MTTTIVLFDLEPGVGSVGHERPDRAIAPLSVSALRRIDHFEVSRAAGLLCGGARSSEC